MDDVAKDVGILSIVAAGHIVNAIAAEDETTGRRHDGRTMDSGHSVFRVKHPRVFFRKTRDEVARMQRVLRS